MITSIQGAHKLVEAMVLTKIHLINSTTKFLKIRAEHIMNHTPKDQHEREKGKMC
jgi:hypothetical protein